MEDREERVLEIHLITNSWMVDLVEVDQLVIIRGEKVEDTLEEASLEVDMKRNQGAAGRTFPATTVTRGARRQELAIKEMVTSLRALKVSDWLELIGEYKHFQ